MTDDDGVTLRADRWQVSVSEKRSTGEYENTEPYTSLEGELPAPQSELTPERRAEIREQLLALHRDLQAVTEQAATNRVRDLPEHEDWSDPLAEEDEGD